MRRAYKGRGQGIGLLDLGCPVPCGGGCTFRRVAVRQPVQFPIGNHKFCKSTIEAHVQLGKYPRYWRAEVLPLGELNCNFCGESIGAVRPALFAFRDCAGHDSYSPGGTSMKTGDGVGSQESKVLICDAANCFKNGTQVLPRLHLGRRRWHSNAQRTLHRTQMFRPRD